VQLPAPLAERLVFFWNLLRNFGYDSAVCLRNLAYACGLKQSYYKAIECFGFKSETSFFIHNSRRGYHRSVRRRRMLAALSLAFACNASWLGSWDAHEERLLCGACILDLSISSVAGSYYGG